jgi:hypothetical protein
VSAGFVVWSSSSSARPLTEPIAQTPTAHSKATTAESKAQPNGTSERFRAQWKEVRAKYPDVAAAYLESLEFIIDPVLLPNSPEVALRAERLADRLRDLGFLRFRCRFVCDPPPSGDPEKPRPEVCPRCRPSINVEDTQRYLECLEERIACEH